MATGGIVAAAITIIFALEVSHAAERLVDTAGDASDGERQKLLGEASKLEQLGHQAAAMLPLVFTVIVCTAALYGLLVRRMVTLLALADPSPQGVVFAGVSPLIVELAEILSELKIPVLVVDRNYDSLSQARMSGVTTENVNILSEYASE